MKNFFLVIIVSTCFLNVLNSQEIQNYILPKDNYKGIDKDAHEKIISLSNEMKNGKDPSFESVSAIFPDYMNYPKAIVGIKEHHGRFLSSWDGAIIFPPLYLSFEMEQPMGFGTAGNLGRRFLEATPFESDDVKKLDNSLVDGYLPMIVRTFEHGGLIYEQTVFGYAEEFLTESPLIAFVRMKVKNTLSQDRSTILSVRFRGTGTRPASQIWATSGAEIIHCPMVLSPDKEQILNENGDVVFWSSTPDGVFGKDKISFTLSLKANEEKELYFCTPFEPLRRSSIKELSKSYYDEVFVKVKDYWNGIVNKGMQINVPEKIVNDAYKTWHFNNFLLVQEDLSRRTYKTTDAPFFYEGIFGYAAAMYLNTITTAGHYEEAKKCAKMFLDLQYPDGSISGVNRSNGIIPHQHGAILHTISQIYRKGRDKEWFASVAPDLIRGCNWIINERAKTMKLEQGKKTLTYGMLPPYRSNVDNGPGTQEYLGNAWSWAGLNQVAKALKEIGGKYSREGNRLQKEADLYRADLLASMDMAVIKEENSLPFLPLDVTERKPYEYLVENNTGIYYGMLGARMLESEIFDADDKRLPLIPDFLEERKGIILGIARHGANVANRLGFTAHFAAGYGITNLRLGRIDRSLLTFYGMLSYGMARNLYSTQEHDNFISGKNDGWYYARQPHLHSTSELIRITNEMLLHEERDEIWLSKGVPRKWLENGKAIEVTNAQTCFGPYSYRIESNVSKGIIKANLTSSFTHNTPSAIKLSLRHPEGKAITKVEVNGKPWNNFKGDEIHLTGTGKKTSIVAYF